MMMFSRGMYAFSVTLFLDFGGDAGADGAAAFADREAQAFFHRDRRDQLDRHLGVVPRHHHLHPRRQLHRPRHVRRPQVKLRPIALEKRRVPPPLLLRQHVHLSVKRRVRRDRPRLRQHHPPLHLVLLHPPQQQPHIVPRLPLVQQLPKHLHPRHHRLLVRPKPHHLHLILHLHLPPLNPPRRHRAPPRNRKHILHRHQKRLVHLPLRNRNALVQRVHQLPHLRHRRLVPRNRLQRRPPNHRNVVPRKLVLRQQLPHLQLHQVHQLRVVHQVALVQKHHDRRHIHLPRQQNVLPRLRHRPVHRRHHQNRPVHLRRPRDHVLHVVGVPRAVHVRIVALLRRILHVRRRNRQNLGRIPPPLRLRRLRHLIVRHVGRQPLLRRHLRQRRRQRRLPVVHMPNRPHVHVRLGPLKLRFRHNSSNTLKNCVKERRQEPTSRNTVGDVALRRFSSTLLLDASSRRFFSTSSGFPKLATGIEPVTSSLPRTRSTD